MIGNRFHCRTNTEPKRSVMLFAACLCLAIMLLGQSAVLACVAEDLHAEIEHSIGAPGPWSTGNFSVVVGQAVYFRAVDAFGNLALAIDPDALCDEQHSDTAKYEWDFDYNSGEPYEPSLDDDNIEPDPKTFSDNETGPYIVRLDVDDEGIYECRTDDPAVYDEITMTVVGPTLYVDADAGNDANDGMSWGDAKETIQGAIDVAIAGQEIWVVADTYEETVVLKDAVGVYGGFVGTESSLSEREPHTNITTIEGLVSSPPGRSSATVIDGFTIDGDGTEYFGVVISDSSPVVCNNVFQNQSAYGIRCSGDSSPTITNNLILNSQGVGRGIEVRCSADIVNNTICGFSKGIACTYSGSPDIYNNIVAFNDINMYCDGVSTPTLGYNCVYGHTTAPYSGLSAGTGDIDDDPGFVDRYGGDYHLSVCSHCIDAGSDVSGVPNVDFYGHQRPFGTSVDIGLDEAQFSRDTTGPSLAIVSPMGTTWNMVSVQPIVIKWTTIDAESGIDAGTVQIDTGSGWSSNVSYDSGSGTWSHTWNSPTTTTISIRATNNCGNTNTLSAGITVTTTSAIFVNDAKADDTGNGLTWATAKKTVQAGINAASAGEDEVWVAAATYVENISLANGVELYGGFAGDEVAREQRNWLVNETILDGDDNGSVISAGSTVTSSSRVDGFTIQNGNKNGAGGGIYLIDASSSSHTIVNNTIKQNTATIAGGGIYVGDSCVSRIANNAIVDNTALYGGGIAIFSNACEMVNNTVACNSLLQYGEGGGVYIWGSDPTISNCIVASNDVSGISGVEDSSPALSHNCVYGNTTNYDGIDDPTGFYGNIPDDPLLSVDHVHVQAGSPCKDAGLNTYVELGDLDIDGTYRIQDGAVDIGADEVTGCVWPLLTLTAQQYSTSTGETIILTAHLHNPAHQIPVPGEQIHISVGSGQIVAISPGGHIDSPPTSGYGITDCNGDVQVQVSSSTPQMVRVTAAVIACGTEVATSAPVWFGIDPPVVVFCIDCTGSTDSGEDIREGVCATVDYLDNYGAIFSGVKFNDDSQLKYEGGSLTTDTAAFKTWVSDTHFGGGDNEYPFAALVAAKNIAPGGYLALATDDDSDDWEYELEETADLLEAAGCIVFVDPGRAYIYEPLVNLLQYYAPLAVNGGVVELSTFTFPSLRQAITGE